ncbi:MAG: hypothetical protein AB1390_12410 [Nitrospirota bacterium]
MKATFMHVIPKLLIFSLILACLVLSEDIGTAQALTKPLRTEKAQLSDITGTFKLILYGGRYLDDVETVAILDKEGDKYDIEPYAPDFDYKVRKGVSAEEAIREAERFVSFHNSFHRLVVSKIMDKQGNTIGFEFRPLYYPFAFGISDVMDIYYWLKEGGRVKVTIRLVPSVERPLLFRGNGDFGNGD